LKKAGILLLATLLALGAWYASGFRGFPVSTPEQSAATAPAPASRPPTQPSGLAPPAPLGNDSSVSKVPLPLILAGTLPGRNAREGEALIGVNENSPQTYKAGALLINGARLVEIYPKYVVLEKDGRSARLYLQNTKGSADANDAVLAVGGVPAAAAVVRGTV